MTASLIHWFIYAILGIFFVLISDWLSGNGLFFSGQNADERKKAIKQKAIVQSWLSLILLFAIDIMQNHFFTDSRYSFNVYYPIFYIIMAFLTFFIFFIYNSIKMSAGSKRR